MGKFKVRFRKQMQIIGRKRRFSNSCYYYFTDVEIPFLELIYYNVPAIARIFMWNTIINGGSVFVYLMIYVATSMDESSPGLFVGGRKNGTGIQITPDNLYLSYWLFVNLGLAAVDMLLTMLLMIRLTYHNFKCFVKIVYAYKLLSWGVSLWGTYIVFNDKKYKLTEYYTEKMLKIMRSMLYQRWLSLIWVFGTMVLYTSIIMINVWRHVDTYGNMLKFIRTKSRLYDDQKDEADAACSICLSEFREEPTNRIIQLKCNT